MKTNPEEFVVEEGVPAKWDNLIRSYEGVLPPEDVEVFKKARNELLQQQFTEKVLEELVDPKKLAKWETVGMVTSNMPLGGQTLGAYTNSPATLTVATNPNSITLGSTTINESHLEHLRAHVDAMKREVDSQELKKPKTIFGRLFNYQ
jgi:hypothetical protein